MRLMCSLNENLTRRTNNRRTRSQISPHFVQLDYELVTTFASCELKYARGLMVQRLNPHILQYS